MTEDPKSFRQTPAEKRDIKMLMDAGVSNNPSGVMHRALERGLFVLKIERGIIQTVDVQKIERGLEA